MKKNITQIIVNDNDEVIGHKLRKDIGLDDIYRISVLDIRNSRWDILLAQRWFLKKKSPGKRSIAVAGTVDTGETYEENIYKEAQEEIGLSWYIFKKWNKIRNIQKGSNYFSQQYSLILEKPIEEFILEEWQVANLRWFSLEELKHLLIISPEIFISSFTKAMKQELF